MGIELFWDNPEETVLLTEFNGRWKWEELHAVLKTTKKITTDRDDTIGAILDLRNGLNIPGGSIFNRTALNNFKEMLTMSDDGKNKGPIVIVGMNGMVKMIFDAVKKMDKSATEDVYFADSMQEARNIMENRLTGDKRITA